MDWVKVEDGLPNVMRWITIKFVREGQVMYVSDFVTGTTLDCSEPDKSIIAGNGVIYRTEHITHWQYITEPKEET